MIDFLKAIADFFSAIGSLLVNLVQGLLSIVPMIAQSLVFLTYVYAYIPSVLLMFIVAGIAVCVVYFLIGR